jgi:hypothetical protein
VPKPYLKVQMGPIADAILAHLGDLSTWIHRFSYLSIDAIQVSIQGVDGLSFLNAGSFPGSLNAGGLVGKVIFDNERIAVTVIGFGFRQFGVGQFAVRIADGLDLPGVDFSGEHDRTGIRGVDWGTKRSGGSEIDAWMVFPLKSLGQDGMIDGADSFCIGWAAGRIPGEVVSKFGAVFARG